jgi:hypothetical protein
MDFHLIRNTYAVSLRYSGDAEAVTWTCFGDARRVRELRKLRILILNQTQSVN